MSVELFGPALVPVLYMRVLYLLGLTVQYVQDPDAVAGAGQSDQTM